MEASLDLGELFFSQASVYVVSNIDTAIMGRSSKSFKKVLRQFIQDLCDDDLIAFPASVGTI